MKQEEKELLFKDLCARLPYGVMIEGLEHPEVMTIKHLAIISAMSAEPYKPYLRPMSLMTEQELHELAYKVLQQPDLDLVKNIETLDIRFSDLDTLTTWLNSRYLDYRGLIEKGLALKAPEGMYK